MTKSYPCCMFVLFVLASLIHETGGAVGNACNPESCVAVTESCVSNQCACAPQYAAIGTTCVRSCPPPNSINKGNFTISPNTSALRFEATYMCNTGYQLSGDKTRICQPDGVWSGQDPICVDPCNPQPCPVFNGSQTACVPRIDSPGHVCICPVGLKGPNCSDEDPPINCSQRNKQIRFEENPTVENKTGCMPMTNTTADNPCYNPNEDVVYVFSGTPDISVYEKDLRFCLIYLKNTSTEASKCVNILAFEADDRFYRPWINQTFPFCFDFNKPPRLERPTGKPRLFNVPYMPNMEVIPINATDPDINQILTLSIQNVIPAELRSKFSIVNGNLQILNPIDLHPQYPNIFSVTTYVEIMVTDNGIPALHDTMNATLDFIYEELNCSLPQQLFLVPLPIQVDRETLGTIECSAAGKVVNPVFAIKVEAVPITVDDAGVVYYIPNSPNNKGKYNIVIEANYTLTVPLTTRIQFTVFAAEFFPRCNKTSDDPALDDFSEKTPVGTCSPILFVCDGPLHLQRNCSDTSDLFNVSCNRNPANVTEVSLCTVQSLDGLAGKKESVSVDVENYYGSSGITAEVLIKNVNDPPVIRADYEYIVVEILENTTAPYLVVSALPVDDPDIASDRSFDNLTVSLSDLDNQDSALSLPFSASLNRDNVINVTMTKELVPSMRQSYHLLIKVIDSEGLSDSIRLNITVVDINEAPVCNPDTITSQATVRDPVGYVITKLSCTDTDFSSKFGQNSLVSVLEGDSNTTAYFTIDKIGQITLAKSLSDITVARVLTFSARVTDGGGLSDIVVITVNVSTSYPPVCERYDVIGETTEKTPVGNCIVLRVNCSDPVSNQKLTFSDFTGNGSQLFTLKPTETTNENLTFCVATSLVGKIGLLQINFVVASSFGTRAVRVGINVTDVNDPPTCVQSKVFVNATVKNKAGEELTRLTCSDADVSPSYKVLSYRLVGTAADIAYFQINQGIITLTKDLADVTSNSLVFSVEVLDGGGLSVTITINVTISSSFPPECDKTIFEISKTEKSGDCFVLTTNCRDPVKQQTLAFRDILGNGTTLFSMRLNETKNELFTFCPTVSLQGRIGVWQISLLVASTYGTQRVEVKITVTDENDSPVCSSTNISAQASVRDTAGLEVTRLTCSDPDVVPSYSTLTYTAEGTADVLAYFSVNNGVVTLAKGLADFVNSDNMLRFSVKVQDDGGLFTTVSVNVNVSNSYPPNCTSYDVSITTTEKKPLAECLNMKVPCQDTIDPTGSLTFRISSSAGGNGTQLFRLPNETLSGGNISFCPTSSLQGQIGKWTINGKLISKYGERDLRFHIYIEDVNDPVVCTESVISTSATVLNPVGYIVASLNCTDPDINTTFRSLTYSLSGDLNTRAYFTVDNNGVLRLAKVLQDQTTLNTVLAFSVVVVDGGGISKSVDVKVSVANNYPPKCASSTFTESISESAGADVCFGVQVGCTEQVRNQLLQYSVKAGNGTILFRLNKNDSQLNSHLSVCTNVALQGRYGTYELSVTVTSSYGEVSITVIILVTDKNDPPVFSTAVYLQSVYENATVGQNILSVSATDTDSGSFGKVDYYSQGIDASAYFSLDSKSGTISVKSLMDADRSSSYVYVFEVKAIDGASPPLSATTTVSIEVLDINDEAPRCEPASTPVNMRLLDPVGTLARSLNCTDLDRTPKFSLIQYSTTSTLFAVNSTGHVTLSAPFPRNQTQHTVQIKVVDSDRQTDLNFTVNIQFVVNVNTNFPPVCSQVSIKKTLSETERLGVCLDPEVICTDPTGASVNITSQTGLGLDKLLEIRTHQEPVKLGLSACVKSSLKDQFGTFGVIVVVSNGLGTTEINWTLTVENVNEPPVFTPSNITIELPENYNTFNSAILVLNVTDPDDGKGNANFELNTVYVERTNDAAFNGRLNDSILYFDAVKSFYARSAFNATLRNSYKYRAFAIDRSNLNATATVDIRITDVNSAPICTPTTLQGSTNILAVVNTAIVALFCYDTDIDPQNVMLKYSIVSGDTGGYFSMTSVGKLIIAKKLPRDALYNTGRAVMQVSVSDTGTPPLTTSVSVTVQVDNAIPAVCNPVITPPDIWVKDKCVRINMDCTDPTLAGITHLTFTPSGNYTAGFTIQSNSQGNITMCYNLVQSGNYQINIQVDNGLKAYQFSDTIAVSYLQATPVFSLPRYAQIVLETTAANSVILKVSASSGNLVGALVYRILGSDSTLGWDSYFTMKESTGEISTKTSVKDLATFVFVLRVEVEDTGSKLKSSVQVEIKVEDVNERPTCDIVTDLSTLNIDVDVAVNTTVVRFSCSDPDVKPEYRTLTYQLSGTQVQSYFKLVGSPASSIAVSNPLDVSTGSYVVKLTVSDNATSPLAFTRDFSFAVNRLPPPVEVSPIALTYSIIQVSWRYAREAYYQVTTNFKVKVFTANNLPVRESLPLSSDTRVYNVTGLEADSAYTILVETFTLYGTRTSKQWVVGTKEIPVLKYFTSTIHAPGIEYNTRLRDTGSQLYFTTKQTVLEQMESVLRNTAGFAGIELKGFRPSHSIFVDTVVAVNQTGNVQSTMDALGKTVSTGWIGSFSVDSAYYVASLGAGYIQIDGLSHDPKIISNGTTVILTCNITTVAYPESANFTYWWTYNGNKLMPTSQSRYSITITQEPLVYEYKHSILKIDPILSQHAGIYGCHVTDVNSKQLQDKTITVAVISQPIVIITPKSLTVNYNDTLNITCEVVYRPGVFEKFIWYRNDEPYRQASNEAVTSTENSVTITVTKIKESVVFGCEGKNEAGSSTRVIASIGVIQPNTPDERLCIEMTDSRGTLWPKTVPGATARLECGPGFTGEKYRACDASGVWQIPVYSCVRNEIVTLERETMNIKDGSSTKNLSVVLGELNTATKNEDLFEGDIDTTLNTLGLAVDITEDNIKIDESKTQADNFLEVASNLIDERNKPSWVSKIEVKQEGAIGIPQVVERYLNNKLDKLILNTDRTFSVKNIYVKIGYEKRDKYDFPDKSDTLPDWVATAGSGISIPAQSFKDLQTVHFASSVFRNISSILVTKLGQNGVVRDITSERDINSDIVAFQLKETLTLIDPPAKITFQHFDRNYSDPICSFWDFQQGAFVTDGCSLLSTTDEQTVCACNHFTNFAVLMSPGKTPLADEMALSIISAVGCGISIFCLALTIALYLLVWRFVKSDRAVLLMNLCAALIISYIIFLAGVDRVENKSACTAVAALMHFFYLAVFFLMLAYGIEIAVSVVYVFFTRSRIKWLLPLAWGLPLIIVGISLGATQLKGYGNDKFCWLSIEDGVLWAFVGPAGLVILINFVIVIIVLRTMFRSSAMLTKSDKVKAVTGVRSICVLLPILGLTWVFGMLSVNEDLFAFQYIFAICNSLQGFLIFLFHCVFNKQLKQALKQRSDRKKTLANIEQSIKNQHSSTGATTYFPSNSSKSTQQNNKVVESGTSNPFLEADRQMKELVANQKKSGNINTNSEVNNKKDLDKGRAVDLDDVKISNLLRESEVMGGTAGISSILHTDTPEMQESAALRSSVATSHRYDYIDPNPAIPKPPGYEKLLQASSPSTSRENVSSRETGHKKDSHEYGSNSSISKEKHKERERQREREIKNEIERERQVKIDKEKRDRYEKERVERERVEKENDERELRERERIDRERREREQRERQRDRSRDNSGVIHIGIDRDVYKGSGIRIDEVPYDRRGYPVSGRSSRSDDDRESRFIERHIRMQRVYLPYRQKSMSSAQNITSISTALPEKFDLYQGKKRQKEAKKHTDSLAKKKDKKKSSLKDRSKAYEYSYDSTYLGGNSRHASLENMNMQHMAYSPYSQLPGMGGHQTGRPTHQQQHWDPYQYPRDPRDPYSRDYW